MEALSSVPIKYTKIEKPRRKQGTTILISDLKESVWDKEALSRLRMGLARMISPYEGVHDFRVIARVGGELLDMGEIARKVRNAAQIRYTLDFDGEIFSIVGRVRFNLFRPEDPEGKALFVELIERDFGEGFFQFLLRQSKAKKFYLKRMSKGSGWFLEYGTIRKFGDILGLKLSDTEEAEPLNPGPFHGEVDSFDLGRPRQGSALDMESDYRKFVSEHHGIRVYRDGFGIRVDRDWLRLGQGWTNAQSYYGLKPNNTLGYIAISARENAKLEETTNREGFKSTSYYYNFYSLLQEFVRFSLDAQSFLRRSYLKFRDANQEKVAEVRVGTTPEEIAKDLNQTLALSGKQNKAIITVRAQLETAANSTSQAIELAEAGLPPDSPEHAALQLTTRELKSTLGEVSTVLGGVESYLQNVAQARSKLDVITNNIVQLREQLSEVYEMVSLGLTAEVLSHEINNIASQLADRNRDLVTYLRRQQP
jgi:predicted HTH domain antitoxin